MEIWQIVGFALIVTVLGVVLRKISPEVSVQLTILAVVTIFLLLLDKIKIVIDLLQNLADQAGINSYYLVIVLKIVGIAYVAEFGAEICKDAGEGALALKVEMAAKIAVLILAIPVILAILESLVRLVM